MSRFCWFCGRCERQFVIVWVAGVAVFVCAECDRDMDDSAAADRQAVYEAMREADRERWDHDASPHEGAA